MKRSLYESSWLAITDNARRTMQHKIREGARAIMTADMEPEQIPRRARMYVYELTFWSSQGAPEDGGNQKRYVVADGLWAAAGQAAAWAARRNDGTILVGLMEAGLLAGRPCQKCQDEQANRPGRDDPSGSDL